jgi:serine/threonine protein kinase
LPLTPGTRLGVYEVTASIGAGGMGQVYRAHDTKLNRDVALKILPDLFASDPDRLARFTREAQTLASLNHSNIAHIHGLEESSGVRALVMELVEGEDLSQRIARGALTLDDALPIAKQVAEALEAAHEQGIIHRDLKPANIKVRADGTVKVLDFGLAKAMEPTGAMSASASMSPTITTPAMTHAGVILGTAAYMSPEQAKGRPVDKRSDLWAFGAVVYEMLTGARAFKDEDVSDTLAAILRSEPDWATLPPDTPALIRTLLRRCLEKDRKRRLDSAAAARVEIEDALTGPSAVEVPPPNPHPGRARRGRVRCRGCWPPPRRSGSPSPYYCSGRRGAWRRRWIGRSRDLTSIWARRCRCPSQACKGAMSPSPPMARGWSTPRATPRSCSRDGWINPTPLSFRAHKAQACRSSRRTGSGSDSCSATR